MTFLSLLTAFSETWLMGEMTPPCFCASPMSLYWTAEEATACFAIKVLMSNTLSILSTCIQHSFSSFDFNSSFFGFVNAISWRSYKIESISDTPPSYMKFDTQFCFNREIYSGETLRKEAISWSFITESLTSWTFVWALQGTRRSLTFFFASFNSSAVIKLLLVNPVL